jgi:hypothetical protein
LGSIRVIHGWKPGAIEKAPSAAVAVDNPSGLSPVVGSGNAFNRRVLRVILDYDVLMDFVDRIAAEIKRGQIRNPDDEEISRLERQFPQDDPDTPGI